MDDENHQAERRHTAAVHLRPVTIEPRDEIQQWVDHERVEQRDPGECDEQLVDGSAKRRPFQEDERDRDGCEEEIDRGTGGRDQDLLSVREIAWIEGDVASESVEAPIQDLAPKEPDHNRVTELVQCYRDRQQDEEGSLIDEHAVFMGEIAVERLPEVASELIDHSHAEDDIKQAD